MGLLIGKSGCYIVKEQFLSVFLIYIYNQVAQQHDILDQDTGFGLGRFVAHYNAFQNAP
jgi:hypothetical protein